MSWVGGHRDREQPPPAVQEAVALEQLQVLAEGLDHPEGVAVAADGTVYAGGEAGQIYAVDPDGAVREVANTGGGQVLGFAADGAGRLYVCEYDLAQVLRIDPANGAVEVFSTGTEERPIRVPNWPAFDAEGTLYVSDSGDWQAADGLIWAIRPGGRAEVWTEAVRDFPNGIALAADGSRLYVVESTPGRLVEVPIRPDGSAGEPRLLQELGMAVVPDGVTVLDDGSLLIACYRPDAIFRWSEGEGLEVLAADPQGTMLAAPANVAFAGPELETLVATNLHGQHLVSAELGVRGAPLFRPPGDLVDG